MRRCFGQSMPGTDSFIDWGNPVNDGLYFSYVMNQHGGLFIPNLTDNPQADGLSFTSSGGNMPIWVEEGVRVGGGVAGYLHASPHALDVANYSNPIRNEAFTIRYIHRPFSMAGGFNTFHTWRNGAGTARSRLFASSASKINLFEISGTSASPTATIAMTSNRTWDTFVVVSNLGTNMKVYQNGTLDFSLASSLTGNVWQNNGMEFWFGHDPGGNTDYDGVFSKIEMWGRDLSYDEIDYLTANPYSNLAYGSTVVFGIGAVSATANADFPTISLTVQTTSETASSTASASFPTITLRVQSTDVTAAASFPTITLSPLTAVGFGSQTVLADFPTIVLTVQSATTVASSIAAASFPTIVLTPPNVRIRPDLRVDPPGYLGRFQRSAFVPFVQAFDHLPDAAPTLHIYRGLTLVTSFQIPLIDNTINVFSDELFLGEEYLDGHYIVVTTWTEDLSDQYKIDYFCVRGGTGRAPIHGVIEQRRPLGQAVISVDETGLSRMAYDPKVPV